MTTATQIRLARRPEGEPDDATYEITHDEVPAPGPGQLLLRVVHLSLDPYMRGRMSAAKSYAAPVEVGDVLVGGTVCQVESSSHPDCADGDWVLSYSGWQTHALSDGSGLRQARPVRRTGVDGARRARHARLHGVRRPAGDRQAAGRRDRRGRGRDGPGRVGGRADRADQGRPGRRHRGRAGQVPGADSRSSASTPRSTTARRRSPADLAAAVPDGIDVYFENVGGHVAAEVFSGTSTSTPGSRSAAWSPSYNATSAPEGPDRLPGFMGLVLRQSLTVRGFIQGEFTKSHGRDFVRDMSGWVADGSVRYREDVVEGLENAPEAFRGLLAGRNFGKLVVQVSDEA